MVKSFPLRKIGLYIVPLHIRFINDLLEVLQSTLIYKMHHNTLFREHWYGRRILKVIDQWKLTILRYK